MDAKQTIIDIANKLRGEVTVEQKAELAGCATPRGCFGFTDWHALIDGLNLTDGECRRFGGVSAAQLRELLHRLVGATRKVGGQTVCIGRRIVRWLVSLLDHYPSSLHAAVLMGALVFLISQIPFLGPVLLPLALAVAEVAVLVVAALETVRMLAGHLTVNH